MNKRVYLSDNDWIGSLQMGRISDNSHLNLIISSTVDTFSRGAQMVLDITGALIGRLELRVELVEDLLERLASHIGEHIETASMRHSHNHRVDAVR